MQGDAMTELLIRDTPWLARKAQRWHAQKTFAAGDLPGAFDLAARKAAVGSSISVAIPALNEERTIGAIARTIVRDLMERTDLVDELIVLDDGSQDATAQRARAAGATVLDTRSLLPHVPPFRGKGDSLWRSLSAVRGDIVVWVDGDIENFDERFVTRLVAPLLLDRDLVFTKAFYRRPFKDETGLRPTGGGRVTELLARPLLASMFPELGGFIQPLSGEYAGRRDVLMRLPFFTGYSVEAGLLIDLIGGAGLDALAQVDLEERVHRNRPLDDLGPMAFAIGRTIMRRAEEWGRMKTSHDYPNMPLLMPTGDGELLERYVPEIERPPMAALLELAAEVGDEPLAALS